MRIIISSVSSVALLFFLACGGNTPEAAAPSTGDADASTPSASQGSPEGGECSDDVAIQKKCAAGLVCGPPKPGAPVSEHTPGVCKKP